MGADRPTPGCGPGWLALFLAWASACGGVVAEQRPDAEPVPVTVSPLEARDAPGVPGGLERVDSTLIAGIVEGVTPGASLAVVRRGRLVRLRGYGWLDHDRATPVTPTTLYDLASLTKVVGTTTAVMILVDDGRLALDDRVTDHLPGWDRGDVRKAGVTVRDLLLHRAGLPPFRPWFTELEGKEAYLRALSEEPLEWAPGVRTAYSDLGAMTLGFVVEAVAGPLDGFLERRVFGPLGMADTRFRPDAPGTRVAPTEVDSVWRGVHVHGEVHDENAHAMGGVAGHAGLFSSARDLAVFAETMRLGGEIGPCTAVPGEGLPCGEPRPSAVRVVQPATVMAFVRRFDHTSSRALGWDTPSGRSSAGAYLSRASFGHTGFTGTSIWVDPERELAVILLTNRVNPTRENRGHVELRRRVHDAVALAFSGGAGPEGGR